MSHIRRWAYHLPYFFALAVLGFAIWVAKFTISAPDDGLGSITRTGVIDSINRGAPSANLIHVGDRIVTVDGVSFSLQSRMYERKQAGDRVEFVVDRSGKMLTITFRLVDPDFEAITERIVPFVISVLLWVVGVVVLAYQPGDPSTRLYFVLSMLGGLSLSLGILSSYLLLGAGVLFNVSLFWIGTVYLHFHLLFPISMNSRGSRWMLLLLYALSSVATSVYLVFHFMSLVKDQYLYYNIASVSRVFLTLSFFAVIGRLLYVYRIIHSIDVRGCIRVVMLGGIFGVFPFACLYIVPDVILGYSFITYPIAILLLGIIPLAYGYAILQHRLIESGSQVSRAATQVMVYALIAGFILLSTSTLHKLLPAEIFENPIVLTTVIVALAAMFPHLRRGFQILLDKAFYGDWYDYRKVVATTTHELSRPLEPEELTAQVLAILRTMRFQAAGLLTIDQGDLVFRDHYGFVGIPVHKLTLPKEGVLIRTLLSQDGPYRRDQLQASLESGSLTEDERLFLELTRIRLWLPLISRGELHGILVLGARHTEPWLSPEDLDILLTLAAMAGVAVDNLGLIQSLKEQLGQLKLARQELAEGHRRLLEGREKERVRLARDLHDGPIQNLHALRMQIGAAMANGRKVPHGEVQERLINVVHELRQICTQLRPPALAHFGLPAAIQSLADQVMAERPELEIHLDLLPPEDPLSELDQLTLYRICQEALNNVVQHAQARRVEIEFFAEADRLRLEILDNGCGFQVPASWLHLARHGHLGLLGIAERVEAAGGSLQILSSPGMGTSLRVTVPLSNSEALTESSPVGVKKE